MNATLPLPRPAPADQALAAPVTPLAEDSLAVLVTSLAGRLNRGASSFYNRHFSLAIADFRILMSLDDLPGLNVREVASQAEVDKAAASRSLKELQRRGLVRMEQTSTRGRAAIVHPTDVGRALAARLRAAARVREERLVGTLDDNERALVSRLLRQLIANVPGMNAD